MKRTKLTKKGSGALFKATASKSHIANNPKLKPMRGGTRR